MAHDFNNFFREQIMTTRNGFQSRGISYAAKSCTSVRDRFAPLSVIEIKQLLKWSSDDFSKGRQDILIPAIAKIINTSLSSGLFPLSMKAALVKPLRKRHSLGTFFQICPTGSRLLKKQLPSD